MAKLHVFVCYFLGWILSGTGLGAQMLNEQSVKPAPMTSPEWLVNFALIPIGALFLIAAACAACAAGLQKAGAP